MKRQTKKAIVGMIALTLLFSTVGPSVTGLVQANDIQVSQQQSEIWDSLEQITFDESDLAFLQQKEKELMASQNVPLLAPRAFSIRMLGRNLEGLWHRSSEMRRALTAVGFGWTQIKALARGVYVYSYGAIASKIATIAAWNWALGAVIGVSAGAAIYTMGNFRLFY
ncbi:hypothetical protein [Lactococcus formosensis]|uniref:hypothetical protein n=1 Tax=Lactococcus formosensis TaxID=1281486 RepID=UPI0013FE04C3|nr:hypothetical protein [Lactococcus formosensis]NHI66837.1 hypothetical protein [Lactococcus garvieae]